jgi:vacuolar-type H+-ATPase subunit I/STV1
MGCVHTRFLLGVFCTAGGPILLANMFLKHVGTVPGYSCVHRPWFAWNFPDIQGAEYSVELQVQGASCLCSICIPGSFLKAVIADGFIGLIQEGMSFFSNMLSYSRLMALGLAGSSIAMAINMIGGIAYEAIPWRPLAVILVLIFLIFAQVISCCLSALVGFVHCMRLQYVEFFPYFFEGGGRMFSPLSIKTKYNKVFLRFVVDYISVCRINKSFLEL